MAVRLSTSDHPRTFHSRPRARRPVSVIILSAALLASACTTGDSRRYSFGAAPEATLAPGVDPHKARTPLADIEPKPVQPVRPDSLEPVSQRAAEQIRKTRTLIAEQRYTEAAIELERALRYDPNHPDIHRTLALLHWEAGNVDRAKTHATKAIEGNPDDAAAHYVLGRCLAAAQLDQDALLQYRTALLCSDLNRDAATAGLVHFYLADTLAAGGYLEAALEQYDAFEQTAPATDGTKTEGATAPRSPERVATARARANLLEQLGRFGEAADALGPVAAAADAEENLRLRHARLLLRAGRLDEARRAALTLPLNHDEGVDLLLEIHTAAGHPERIVDDLSERIAAAPRDAKLVLRLADALSRLNRLADARHQLEAFLARQDDGGDVRLALVDTLARLPDLGAALRAAADGVEKNASRAADFEAKISAYAKDDGAVQALLEPTGGGASPATLFLQGSLARRAGRAGQAETLLTEAWRRAPEFAPARIALARLYLSRFRYDDALEAAKRKDADTPENLELELVLGETYDRLDDVRNAELHCNAAVQLNRADKRALLALARLYNRTDQRLRAQRQLQVLLEKDPNHEAARELLAYTHLADGKLDVAITQIEELGRRAKSPLVKARCAAFLSQAHQQDRETYRRTLLDAMAQHGEDATTWLAIAQSYDEEPDLGKKREACRRALAAEAENEEAAIGVIDTSRRLLDFEEAIRLLESLLRRRPNRDVWRLGYAERSPGHGEYWPGLIELYWDVQDHDAALSLARTAEGRVGLDDSFRKRYRQAIIDTLRFARREDELVTQLTTWKDAEPDDTTWSVLLADAYLRANKAAQAIPLLRSIYESTPRWPMLANLLQALVNADQHDRAKQYLLDWLQNDPESDEALSRLALIEADAGRVDDAVELIRNRLLRTLDREQFQTILLSVLSQADRHGEASDFAERLMETVQSLARAGHGQEEAVLDHSPTDEERIRLPNEPFTADRLENRVLGLRFLQVSLDFAAKDYRSAQQRLAEWLDAARDPRERYEYLNRLAISHRLGGDEAKAGEFLARALLLRPDDMTLNNDIAYAWIDRGERLNEAERMIRHSLSRAPRQSAYLDTFGWLQYKRGSFAEAAKWIGRARNNRIADDPVILDHLGDVQWRLGKHNEAIELWEAAVKAANERTESETVSEDEKRVRADAPGKLEAARAEREPAVAPLAKPEAANGSTEPQAKQAD